MKHRQVFVIGGAGFLGYHTCHELLGRGARVTCMALPDEKVDERLESKVQMVRGDIDDCSDMKLGELLLRHDVLIYAAGPDDRVELPAGVSATEFFQEHLVERTARIVRLAKQRNVKKVIIFGSYFSYINNHGLAGIQKGQLERHPYIKARVEQTKRSFALGDDDFEVAVLNIPYVFGTAPGKEPIWRNVFVERFGQSPKIYYGNGGTTLISAKKIAFATAQALEHAKHGDELAVGSKNMKFTPMIEQLLAAAEIDKPVGSLPNWVMRLVMKSQWKKAHKAGMDSGLDLRYLTDDILKRDFYVDYTVTDEKLRMSDYVDDVDEAITETGERMRKKSLEK